MGWGSSLVRTALCMRAQMLQKRRRYPAKEVTFQGSDPDRARCAFIGDQNRTAVGPLFQCHFRHDGDAQSRRHHSQNAAELTALEHDLREYPRTFADLDGGVAEAMVIAQGQEGLIAQLLHHHTASSG